MSSKAARADRSVLECCLRGDAKAAKSFLISNPHEICTHVLNQLVDALEDGPASRPAAPVSHCGQRANGGGRRRRPDPGSDVDAGESEGSSDEESARSAAETATNPSKSLTTCIVMCIKAYGAAAGAKTAGDNGSDGRDAEQGSCRCNCCNASMRDHHRSSNYCGASPLTLLLYRVLASKHLYYDRNYDIARCIIKHSGMTTPQLNECVFVASSPAGTDDAGTSAAACDGRSSSLDNVGTPLHAAAASGTFELVWLLERLGARPSVVMRDGAGRTPSQVAAQHEYMDIADFLLGVEAELTMASDVGHA